ncbi:hypothetical protein [Streptomyces sp. NPDC093093]|uniref:hypothetical protein n=1 Tax=Streptomyces sp. NPDC093093 TaxID=3366025 RepID=UPI00382345EE
MSGELPLEGWTETVVHCQPDEVGPSDEHPDLVRLKVSLPPSERAPRSPEVKVIQGFTDWPRWLLLDLGIPLPPEPPAVPVHVQELLERAGPLLVPPLMALPEIGHPVLGVTPDLLAGSPQRCTG